MSRSERSAGRSRQEATTNSTASDRIDADRGLAGFITGLKVKALCADLATFVPGRAPDDNAHVMLRYERGARGLLRSSQVTIGCSNGLRLRVFGETGSLTWFQEEPNVLLHAALNGRLNAVKRGREDVDQGARLRTRTPPGHPEGYI